MFEFRDYQALREFKHLKKKGVKVISGKYNGLPVENYSSLDSEIGKRIVLKKLE